MRAHRNPQVAYVALLAALSLLSTGAAGASGIEAERGSTPLASSGAARCDTRNFDAVQSRFLELNAARATDSTAPDERLRRSAAEYIAVAEACYAAAGGSESSTHPVGPVITIDDGGLWVAGSLGARFAFIGTKWGSGSPFAAPPSAAGGTVTYSLMPDGVSLSGDAVSSPGTSVAIQSLPTYQPCFQNDIDAAFAAWGAVANIQFTKVTDNGAAFGASGAQGDIRIGAHTFDGSSNVLAHGYYPPPNGVSQAGDVHFDRSENWSCNTTGIDIGIVTLHELGHSIGLMHQSAVQAVMNPVYNPGLSTLQSDDISGAVAIYGPAPAVTLTLSGNAGLPGAAVTYTGGSTVADATGAYSINVTSPWTGTVTPSNGDYTFTPAQRSYAGLTIDQMGQDFAADLFEDVPVSGKEWMEPWINALYDAGITTGCGASPLVYCPESPVTRAAMAVFLLRAKHGSAYTPPAATHTFSDMPVAGKEWMEPWVDQFYAEGLTTGCGVGPPQFCPESPVTRAAMAVFLLRAVHDPGFAPPPAGGLFSDVPVVGKEWMEPWITQFYSEGITTGCGTDPLRYCPENAVTRAAMAVFLGRAYGLHP